MASQAASTSDLFAPPPAPQEQLSPETLRELSRIWSSPALGEAVNRRAQAYLRHGHTIDDDRQRPLFDLPRKSAEYLSAALDQIGHDKGGPATSAEQAERRQRALVKLATAAALLLAAHDALAWACALEARPGADA